MDELISRTGRFIKMNHMIPSGSMVVAAVSGGADSLALLLILDELRASSLIGPFDLAVAHVHHGLRGTAADEDMAFVQDWSNRLGLPFYSVKADVAGRAGQNHIGLELAGRQARQEFFAGLTSRLAQTGQPGCPERVVRIALAHHRDDQAETLLLHLGRGSGLDGLTGMGPVTGSLIRPLLELSRFEIERWLAGKRISWCQDASNADTFTMRNRIRHQVLPVWKQALGYDPAPLLCRAADNLAVDRQYLDRLARDAWRAARNEDRLDAVRLMDLDPSLQIRVLRLFWHDRTGTTDNLANCHVQNILAWLPAALTKAGQQSLDLPGGRRLWLRNTVLSLETAGLPPIRPAAAPPEAMTGVVVNLPGETKWPELHLSLSAFFIEKESQIVYNDAMEYFRLDQIRGCVLRLRQPGDRIHPCRRQGGKTLKKFLNEQLVPPSQRSQLPLVALGREIVWLPGYSAGAGFVAGPGGGDQGIIVQLRLQREQSPEMVTEDAAGVGQKA
ncbi:MAG: tRNA lysidine(34) synthetase TilS [Clostridiaceae bacterium]|nr:tRNA lysidine(34) synthetase TilS [Clostridiaceae bacterium]